MRTVIVNLIIWSIVGLLSGCALDLGLKPDPAANHYMLTEAVTPTTISMDETVPTIAVDRPLANSFLSSSGIATIQPNQKALYYAKGKWATALPEMVQNAVIRALNATDQVRAFNNTQSGVPKDYKLVWSIDDFYARYTDMKSPPNILITLNTWLIDKDSGKTIATNAFTNTRTSPGVAIEPIIRSFNSTTKTVLTQMSDWATRKVAHHEIVKAQKKCEKQQSQQQQTSEDQNSLSNQ